MRIFVSIQAVKLIKREVFMFLLMFLIVALAWKKATIKNINKNTNTEWKHLIGGDVLFVDIAVALGTLLLTLDWFGRKWKGAKWRISEVRPTRTGQVSNNGLSLQRP